MPHLDIHVSIHLLHYHTPDGRAEVVEEGEVAYIWHSLYNVCSFVKPCLFAKSVMTGWERRVGEPVKVQKDLYHIRNEPTQGG